MRVPYLTALSLSVLPAVAIGQPAASDLAVRLAGMTAVTGYEQRLADSLLTLLAARHPVRDRAGNVVVSLGRGAPTRLAACPIDEWGYVVGGIREDGWLTLRRVGSGQPPLWDQMHEGHGVTVWGASGPVPAVMAVPSTHLARGRAGIPNTPFTTDDALVDTGARTPAELASLGIRLVDPVALAKHPHRYGGGGLAAPDAARRGGCAALLHAALAAGPSAGTTIVAFTVESRLGHRGLQTLAHTYAPSQSLLIEYQVPRSLHAPLGEVAHLMIPTRYGGTAVETIQLPEIDRIAGDIRQWVEGRP